MIQAIVSDLDGTLLGANHRVGQRTIDVLQTLHQQQIAIILATGRPYGDVKHIRRLLGVDMYLITSNGARIHDPKGNCIFAHDLPEAIIPTLIQTDSPGHLNVYQDEEWLVIEENSQLLEFHKDSGYTYRKVEPAAIPHTGVAKVFWTGPHQELLHTRDLLQQQFAGQIAITFADPSSLEVMARGVNKGAAVEHVLSLNSIKPANAMAFGDGENDVEMLSRVGHPHRMANASAELNQALPNTPVIGHVKDEAVARYLSDYFALDQQCV